MKKIALISAIAISSLFYNTAKAQLSIHVGLHLSPRTVYVPARVVVARPAPVVYTEPVNYSGDEDYFYLPEVDAYYSVPEQCYYYNNGASWVSAAYLPGAYRNYDWRAARRFEVRAPRPFIHNDYYRARYGGVAFNGRWNERVVYNHNYDNRFNHDQYSRNDYRFDNHGHSRNDGRMAQNNSHGYDRGRDNHRPGRF